MEYGFPSTHSTNSISIALFFFTIIHRLHNTPSTTLSPPIMSSDPLLQNATHIAEDVLPEMQISLTTYIICVSTLTFYVFSIVFGRIYTGMHSFVDCACGAALGAGLWGLYVLVGETVDSWLRNSGWIGKSRVLDRKRRSNTFIVPIIVVPFCLLLVHRHPEPVDDCPCFEDAIAFMSVVMGEFLTRWYMYRNNYDETFFVRSMPGKARGSWAEMQLWWSIAAAKMVVGILAIFAWRIFAKALMHRVLPPTFRLLARLTTLPHRRYYTPATDYTGVPSEKGLHPIPSVLDLPGMLELDSDSVSTAHKPYALSSQAIKLRAGKGTVKFEKSANITAASREGLGLGLQEMGGKRGDVVAHYDADGESLYYVFAYTAS